jgi:cell wall-associated NlpC family hydrolase
VFLQKSVIGSWQEVETPDGRTGYIEKNSLKKYINPDTSKLPKRQDVVDQAKKMMGIPYLWGGHSTKGLDCSGFTSTVFRSLGYQLPRDANMQVELGQEIIPTDDYSNILPGDLIFFGPENRITHVGICLGGGHFIHASGDVHINSLDEQDARFNEDRKKAYKNIKRIIKD